MFKNWKFFRKIIISPDFITKIIILIVIGLFSRFLVSTLLNSNFIIENLSFYLSIISFNRVFTWLVNHFYINLFYKHACSLNLKPLDLVLNNDYSLKNQCRRRIHWILFQQFTSDYSSYSEFRKQWDSNTKLYVEIENKYCEKKRDFLIFKKTLQWFLHGGNKK